MSAKLNFKVVSLSEVPLNGQTDIVGRRHSVVLVVDDERVIADTLSIILSKSGYKALTAYDGVGALEAARNIRPDLLITDVVMPGMTGIELAMTLRQTVPECRVLLFSGQAATVDLLERAREAGHDFTILTKPVPPHDMLRQVSACLSMSEGSITDRCSL
ncbi:response regulator [Granulicella arctica]|uniref:CheY-like chemotaxis protein n=1 Tax=Granulicella arctica TaxID=940613 RepID=A0A7Y9PJX1_9BACT|nr:response regulator [Granulicella arctica]NYF80526.1 CheY-like chemotaxis protein [Granulicella arctica]